MLKFICIITIFFTVNVLSNSLSKINDDKFVLLTSLYNESDARRAEEYLYCLKRNISHPIIGQVHVVYDTSKDSRKNLILQYLKSVPSIRISYVHDRPTFDFLFDLTNRTYLGRK